MKITYTEAAKKELENFKERQINRLEELIKERKYVFGDEDLEITASDIKDAADSFRAASRSDYRYRKIRTIDSLLRIYAVAGILVACGGLLYPYIKDMYESNRMQFIWIAAGVSTTLFSLLMLYMYRETEARFRKFNELEKDLRLREIIQEVEKEANK